MAEDRKCLATTIRLAKVIAHGSTREEAIQKLRAALKDFHILGVKTNLAFLLAVLSEPEFLAGKIDTGYLARNFEHWHPAPPPPFLGALSELSAGTAVSKSTSQIKTTAWSADGFRNV